MTPQHLLKVLSKLPSPALAELRTTPPPQPFKDILKNSNSLSDDPFLTLSKDSSNTTSQMKFTQETADINTSPSQKVNQKGLNSILESPSKAIHSKMLLQLMSLLDGNHLNDEKAVLDLNDKTDSMVLQAIKGKIEKLDLTELTKSTNQSTVSEEIYILLRKVIKEVKIDFQRVESDRADEEKICNEGFVDLNQMISHSDEEKKTIKDIENTRKNIAKERQELARLQSFFQTKLMQQKELATKIEQMEENVSSVHANLQQKKEEYARTMGEQQELTRTSKDTNWVAFALYFAFVAFLCMESKR